MYLRDGVRGVAGQFAEIGAGVLEGVAEHALRLQDGVEGVEPQLAALLGRAADVRHSRLVRVRGLQEESAVVQLLHLHLVHLELRCGRMSYGALAFRLDELSFIVGSCNNHK